MLLIFLNIGLEYNCMRLCHFFQLENDFIWFCILGVRWPKVKILTQLKTQRHTKQTCNSTFTKRCYHFTSKKEWILWTLRIYHRMWLNASGNYANHSLCRKFSDIKCELFHWLLYYVTDSMPYELSGVIILVGNYRLSLYYFRTLEIILFTL